jgi:hypothetical protein
VSGAKSRPDAEGSSSAGNWGDVPSESYYSRPAWTMLDIGRSEVTGSGSTK